MDTRRKILTPSKALEAALALRASGTSITLITGYFDVLQPSLIRQMAATGARVFALVLDPPDPRFSVHSLSARAGFARRGPAESPGHSVSVVHRRSQS